ncbi:MAG: hypothetical protein V2B18_06615, partial [Pseudomonadota bacterium]
LDVSKGDRRYVMLNGKEDELKPGDMFIADSDGVISSIVYGPDKRTMINDGTTRVLFTVYGVPGIDPAVMERHLDEMESYVRIVAPAARTEYKGVCGR